MSHDKPFVEKVSYVISFLAIAYAVLAIIYTVYIFNSDVPAVKTAKNITSCAIYFVLSGTYFWYLYAHKAHKKHTHDSTDELTSLIT